MRLDVFFLVSRSTSGGVFWGVCGLIMILGSLSANGWGCVPVLLVFWHRVFSTVACWSLSGAGCWRWDGDLWEIFAVWYYVELGGLLWTSVLNLALPPQRHSPDAWLEHQEPVIHMACDQYGQSCDITVEKSLLSNWELRWMGFLPSPDGWRLRFLFLVTLPRPHFY